MDKSLKSFTRKNEKTPGVLIEQNPTQLANEFIKAMTKQRFWDRAYE
ncbi:MULTISPECIES: hypothetical protein [Bacillus]|uniref:Catalase n=1 Tax=Bacillus paramobilis TaxID=2817477 RepID=A0ABZ2VR75_9BACI|nr:MULTISPECIES: hypothetical protein [Bacillus]BCD31822.1 hypothetical protein BC30102_4858 [Bacillus cereus]HDX9574141.1 hypothetical protein [Bacillus mobilis]